MSRSIRRIALIAVVWLGPGAVAAQTVLGPGERPELTIGTDGRGLVAWTDAGQLRVAHCTDPACSGFTLRSLGSADLVAGAITDPGGRAVILYFSAGFVRVLRCADADCTTGAYSSVAPGTPTGIAIGGDGLPLIAIDDAGVPTIAHCDDAACSARP